MVHIGPSLAFNLMILFPISGAPPRPFPTVVLFKRVRMCASPLEFFSSVFLFLLPQHRVSFPPPCRGSGMLGLLQLLWLLSSQDALPGWCIINQCWRERRGTEQDSFPLAIVSINFTCLAFDAFSRGKLAAQVESAHSSGTDSSVLQVCYTLSPSLFLPSRIESTNFADARHFVSTLLSHSHQFDVLWKMLIHFCRHPLAVH